MRLPADILNEFLLTEPDERRHDEQLHMLVHDLRHCLHVIGMGAEILKVAHHDSGEFLHTCETILREKNTADRIVAGLLDSWCEGCDPDL